MEVGPATVGGKVEDFWDSRVFDGAALAGSLPLVDVTDDAVGEAGVVTGGGINGRDLDYLLKGLGLEFFGSLDSLPELLGMDSIILIEYFIRRLVGCS